MTFLMGQEVSVHVCHYLNQESVNKLSPKSIMILIVRLRVHIITFSLYFNWTKIKSARVCFILNVSVADLEDYSGEM